MSFTIKEIIDTWREALGPKPPGNAERIPALQDLFETMIAYGHSAEDCKSSRTKSLIVESLIFENVNNALKRKLEKKINQQIIQAFPDSWKPKIHNASPENFSKEIYVPSAPLHEAAKRVAESGFPVEPTWAEEDIEENLPFKRQGKPMDPEFLASLPKPNVIYDDELINLLGGKK